MSPSDEIRTDASTVHRPADAGSPADGDHPVSPLPAGANGETDPSKIAEAKTVIRGSSHGEAKMRPVSGTPASVAQVLLGQHLDHFLLEELIGGGGMGAVFRAHDGQLDRTVAIKVIPFVGNDGDLQRRFRNEAQSAAKLDHPRIARVFGVGHYDDWHYIVFEYIRGTNIRDLVTSAGVLNIDDAVFYTCELAAAIQHAADRGIVHRDIKPSNVLIGDDNNVKLVDMGLARSDNLELTEDKTASGVTLGTFDYISPEQARDPRDADFRSDIYSLGCTLYFMLTGSPPYPGGTMLQKLLSHGNSPPPNPRDLRAEVSHDLSAVIQKMLAKNPDDRYQTASDLIADLREVASRDHLTRAQAIGSVIVQPPNPIVMWLERHSPWLIAASLLLASAGWLQLTAAASREDFSLSPPETAEPPERVLPAIDPSTGLGRDTAASGQTQPRSAPDSAATRDQLDIAPTAVPSDPRTELTLPPESSPNGEPASNNEPATNGESETDGESGTKGESGTNGNAAEASESGTDRESAAGRDSGTEDSKTEGEAGTDGEADADPRPRVDAATEADSGNALRSPTDPFDLRVANDIAAVDPPSLDAPGAPRLVRVVGQRESADLLADDLERYDDGVLLSMSFAEALELAAEYQVKRIEIAAPVVYSEPAQVKSDGLSIVSTIPGGSVIVFESPPTELMERVKLLDVGSNSIEMEDLHFVWTVPPASIDGGALIWLNDNRSVRMTDCSITISNPTAIEEVYAFAVVTDPDAIDWSRRDQTYRDDDQLPLVAIEMNHVIVRGQLTVVHMDYATELNLRWNNGLVAISGRLVDTAGARMLPPPTAGPIQISLTQLTAHVPEGLVRMRLGVSGQYPLLVDRDARRSVFVVDRGSPLLEVTGLESFAEAEILKLRGEANAYVVDSELAHPMLLLVDQNGRERATPISEILTAVPDWFAEKSPRWSVWWSSVRLADVAPDQFLPLHFRQDGTGVSGFDENLLPQLPVVLPANRGVVSPPENAK
jgi:serine/threonine-protein kinase